MWHKERKYGKVLDLWSEKRQMRESDDKMARAGGGWDHSRNTLSFTTLNLGFPLARNPRGGGVQIV